MANKTPIRAVFNDSNVATGLAEFQSGDTIGLTHGGLGVSLSIGTAGQVLKVNSGATALEFGAGATSDFVKISEPADSSATTHNFSDVFTDTYQTYRATFSMWSSSNEPRFRFLSSGTTQMSSSAYDWTGNETGTATSSSNYENQMFGRNTDYCRIHSDQAGHSQQKRHYYDITFHNMRDATDYPHMIWRHWGYCPTIFSYRSFFS